jgi:hypothetical protein
VRPDLIIAVGGGSAIDAAKAIRLFHESPQLSLTELTLPFLDARKRVSQYPQVEHSVRLVAVPTTSGTGSEVSPAAVLTAGGRKLTLVDYSLVPDMAVVDPRLTLTMPPALTADTGVDALTHALEAGVSIFASPYTDAFCMQALHLILDSLPRACADGSDLDARTAMSNAATLAGLAFSNAFVGASSAPSRRSWTTSASRARSRMPGSGRRSSRLPCRRSLKRPPWIRACARTHACRWWRNSSTSCAPARPGVRRPRRTTGRAAGRQPMLRPAGTATVRWPFPSSR